MGRAWRVRPGRQAWFWEVLGFPAAAEKDRVDAMSMAPHHVVLHDRSEGRLVHLHGLAVPELDHEDRVAH
jgi:hypothetical protein